MGLQGVRVPLIAAPTVRRSSTRPLETCGASDVLHDYILEPYEPRAPIQGKLRSVNALYETFALAGLDDRGHAMVEAVRGALGPFRTVWGAKWDEDRGSWRGWELYFYDWKRLHADLSIEALKRILAPFVGIDARPGRELPWHMLSVEVPPAVLGGDGTAVPIHVYVDMRSYELLGDRWTFENVYTFHDPRREIDDVMHRLRASVHVDLSRDALAELIPPALFRCHKLCVANKATGDALYFSRVDTRALLGFLRRGKYPSELIDWLESEKSRLAHLLWDVGVDFTARDGRAHIRRSGFYGSF